MKYLPSEHLDQIASAAVEEVAVAFAAAVAVEAVVVVVVVEELVAVAEPVDFVFV